MLRGDADNDMVKIENLTKVGSELWGSRRGAGRGAGPSSGVKPSQVGAPTLC